MLCFLRHRQCLEKDLDAGFLRVEAIFERVIISIIELCLLLPRIMRHGLGKAYLCKFRSLSPVCNESKIIYLFEDHS